MKLYVIRHGRTPWNEKGLMQGRVNIKLSETGKKEAKDIREKLKDISFDICISSPLKRTLETASIVTDNKYKIITDELLIERNLGEFEGKKYAEYEKLKFWDYKLNNDSYGVEPVKDILKRTSSFLNNLKEKDYKTVLIVSHAATIRAINYNIIGYDSNTDFLDLNLLMEKYMNMKYDEEKYRLRTIKHDEKYLRQTSSDVLKGDPDLKQEIEILSNYCRSNGNLMALASVQIGIPKKIIYIMKTDEYDALKENDFEDKKIVMINPCILEEKGETYYWEACASCMDNMGLVKRPYSIRVEYFDQNFNYKTAVFEGFKATVLSHEYDHLFGILHIDIAEEVYQMPAEERKAWRINHGYKVYSKTGNYEVLRKENSKKKVLIKK